MTPFYGILTTRRERKVVHLFLEDEPSIDMKKPEHIRTMSLMTGQHQVYESAFDKKTGNIVRTVIELEERVDAGGGWVGTRRTRDMINIEDDLRKRFPGRWGGIPSPSPELVDISITNRCSMGCAYCYQNSGPRRKHARKDLVLKALKGFKIAPYQIAIGGGEPVGHPNLPEILYEVHKLGTIPNYTTAGYLFNPEVIDATNRYCGGVALTYHAHKGLDWFEATYRRWRAALKCQLNIHLLADTDVAKNLDDLIELQQKLKERFNLVLLAYYPDIGRATMDRFMPRRVYMVDLPESIQLARTKGMNIAFSEGMLPFFLSRPELGINTQFATPSEGFYSCYIDTRGEMWPSSLVHPRHRADPDRKSIFEESSQSLWNKLRAHRHSSSGESCYYCRVNHQCSSPHTYHTFVCAHASHNALPLKTQRRSRYERISEDE